MEQQKTTLSRSIDISEGKEAYDAACKKVLAEKVYSIWICMNPPKERTNTITEYSFSEKQLVGDVKEKKEYYDLITAVMICLGVREDAMESELLGLLDVLLSSEKNAADKKAILERDYRIPMTEEMEGDVERMCNLSDGVERRGIEIGMVNILVSLVRDNLLSVEEAAKRMNMTVEEFGIEQSKAVCK